MIQFPRLESWGWKGGCASPSPARCGGSRGAAARRCNTARSAPSGAVFTIAYLLCGRRCDAVQRGRPRRDTGRTAATPDGRDIHWADVQCVARGRFAGV